jgi:hypothetical protein
VPQVYRHIVLAVHHLPSGRFGALGISRREELMYKPLRFGSLAELVSDYKAGYEAWWHKLLKVGPPPRRGRLAAACAEARPGAPVLYWVQGCACELCLPLCPAGARGPARGA